LWVAILGIVGFTLELGLPPSIDPAWFLHPLPGLEPASAHEFACSMMIWRFL
jgi:hypothetical protein